MKIAVIGKGKTGQAVIDGLADEQISRVYHSKNPVTLEQLNKADAAIVFVDAQIFQQILPILLTTKTPIICGTTGYAWREAFIEEVNQAGHTWVVANNFSLSMVLIKQMLNTLGKLPLLTEKVNFKLTETHHVQKLDSPSGTALSWQSWLGAKECPIDSIRKEDVKGEHQLVVDNGNETIELKHTAHNRKLFAQGAIWAARYINEHKSLKGFYQFDELVRGVSWS